MGFWVQKTVETVVKDGAVTIIKATVRLASTAQQLGTLNAETVCESGLRRKNMK